MKRLILSLVLLAASFGLLAQPAKAATLSIQGLSVTPDLYQVSLDKNQKSLSYVIRLDNNLKIPISVSVSSLDFKSLNDSGGLFFIGSGASDIDHKYGLAKWIDLPTSKITLAAQGEQFIDVTIKNRTDLAPGGHYAAIIFKINNTPASSTNNVRINQEVSSLLFVRKAGGTYGLPLVKAALNNRLLKWPSSLSLTFANSGDTQTAPLGYVELNGQRVIINENSNLVLPGSQRRYNVKLPAGAGFWPRRYHALIHYRPDAVSGFSVYNASFFYINPWFGVFCLALLAIILIAFKPARCALIWLLLKLDRQVRRLEVYSTHFARFMRHPRRLSKAAGRILVWLGLKADRQLRRLEIWVTKLVRALRKR